MVKYPDWVPTEATKYLESLTARESEIGLLRKIVRSPHMKPAWKTVARKKGKADPARLLSSVLWVNECCDSMDRFATPEQIDGMYTLAADTKKLADQVARKARNFIGEDWHNELGYPLKSFLKIPPFQTLIELAEYFEVCARYMEEERTGLTAYVGKPGSAEAKRVYAIRLMSEQMRVNYGQPLHNVVALTCSEILDEHIDPELVRKLYKDADKRPPYYWSG